MEDLERAEPRYVWRGARVLQGTGYDPGSAAHRFHSALNEYSGLPSAFIRWGHGNPYCDLRQWDAWDNRRVLRDLAESADVLHCHVDYTMLDALKVYSGFEPRSDQVVVRHYHGSLPYDSWMQHDLDQQRFAVRVGARLSHLAEDGASDIIWLPITVPTGRYFKFGSAPYAMRPFRLAHSPTSRKYKQTHLVEQTVEKLRSLGYAIELVLIENKPLYESLQIKGSCHALFDSFWLGLQTSGLEAAAMGLPVLAGDSVVRDLHIARFGYCPWTYVEDEDELSFALVRLMEDQEFYNEEGSRIQTYVSQVHSYQAVAELYTTYVREWLR